MVQFKISNQNVVAALDIGTSSVRCAVVYKEPSSPLERLAYVEGESNGFYQGRVQDFHGAVASLGKILESAEGAAKASFSNLWIGFSCPFQSFRSTGMAALPLREVRKKDVELAMKTACAVPLPERHVKIHSLPQMFSVDGEPPVSNPLGLSGLRLETRVHIVTVPQSYCMDITKVLKELGSAPKGFIHNLIAFSEMAVSDEQKKEGICFCDVGSASTRFIVYKDGQILEMFEIPIGGDDFSKALANQFKIPVYEAENLKIQYGKFFSKLVGEEEQIDLGSQGLFLSYKSFAETLEKTAKKLLYSIKERMQSCSNMPKNFKPWFLFTGQTVFSPGFLNLAGFEWGESILQSVDSLNGSEFKKNNTFSIIDQALRGEVLSGSKSLVNSRKGHSRWAKLRELF